MHSSSILKATPTLDELSPLAGTIGIELVPQSLVLTTDLPTLKSQDKHTHEPAKLESPADGTAKLGPQADGKDTGLELADMRNQQQDAAATGESVPASEAAFKDQQSGLMESETSITFGRLDSAHASDDEAAVLIAHNAESSSSSSAENKQSKSEAAALDRQRVWYKERGVQLTILGCVHLLIMCLLYDDPAMLLLLHTEKPCA